jgi:hypothetical protein
LFFFICPAAAADEATELASTYDMIMMWVNFTILAGVLYKFLKNPSWILSKAKNMKWKKKSKG